MIGKQNRLSQYDDESPLSLRISNLSRSRIMMRFLNYWESCVGPLGHVDRGDIDPILMKDYLPCLFMGHRVGTRFFYDLVETDICEANGRDVTGMFLDDLVSPTEYGSVFSMFEAALNGEAVFYRGSSTLKRVRTSSLTV